MVILMSYFTTSGGTVDITVHQVHGEGCLKELHKASGGAWGGTTVDEAFKQLLIKIFGSEVVGKFCRYVFVRS